MESIFKLANSQGASPFSSSQVNALPSGSNGQWSQGQKSGQTGSPYGAFINQLKTRAQWSRRNGSGSMPMPSRGSMTDFTLARPGSWSSPAGQDGQQSTMGPIVNGGGGSGGGQSGAMWAARIDENGNWVNNPGIGGGSGGGQYTTQPLPYQVGGGPEDWVATTMPLPNPDGRPADWVANPQAFTPGGGQVGTQGPVATQPTPQGDNIVGQNQPNPTQQQYNDAGMGGSYIGSSQNGHVDVSQLPKALQMLASYGVPLSPALIAAVTGQSLSPADPARAFQARGGGILPSYQTLGRMSPDERELFQSYTMGPVGLPWNNTAAAMQAPTANFRSAVRAY